MSDRLTELRRQRALAQEQVAWFDREIARELGDGAPAAATATPTAAVPAASPVPVQTDAQAEKILEEYRAQSGSIKTDVRKGCFVYFFAAFALVGLIVLALYFGLRR